MWNYYFKIFFLVVTLFIASNTYSQTVYTWYPKQSGVNVKLNYIYGNLIAGNNGNILYYDLSDYFLQRNSGTTANINFVKSFYTSSYIAVGENGIVLRTTNDGYSWTQNSPIVSNTLYSIARCVRALPLPTFNRYTCVGSNGIIVDTANNGSGWTIIPSNVTTDLKSISYFSNSRKGWNDSTGVIVGNSGTILRTSNFGNSWQIVSSGVADNLNSVYLIDTLRGFAVGNNGRILYTQNSGATWELRSSGISSNLNSVFFSSKDTGWIAGNNGVILKTANGGNNWYPENTRTTINLNSIYSLSSQNAVAAVGDSGKVFCKQIDTIYRSYVMMNGNNIKSYFNTNGIFNNYQSNSGFFWPSDSNKTAIYSTGLTIAGKINNYLKMASGYYSGQYKPGYCVNGTFQTDDRFKFYKVRRGDNPNSNPDWANWGLMVPYGAPYIDVNNNHIYDQGIDTPGVKNASQTIFLCLTDADSSIHNSYFHTNPLGAEIHLTAWCYDSPALKDVQFLKFVVFNKNLYPWTSVYMGIFCDPDVGDGSDDYIGYDSIRKLGYSYNATNNDAVYGANPPAVGIDLLRGCYNKITTPAINLGFTSFIYINKSSFPGPPCQAEPSTDYQLYRNLKGYTKDSATFLDPTFTPYKKTKFVFAGDPETNTGWNESSGFVTNCVGDTTGNIMHYNGYDRRFSMSSGADNLTMLPGEGQTLVIAQMITRGNNNLNSVTKLKQLDDVVQNFYDAEISIPVKQISSDVPSEYSLQQNYPNPFNATTVIKYQVSKPALIKIKLYNLLGQEVITLVNSYLETGNYEASFDFSNLSSGIYFYKMESGNFSETKKLVLIK